MPGKVTAPALLTQPISLPEGLPGHGSAPANNVTAGPRTPFRAFGTRRISRARGKGLLAAPVAKITQA